MNELKAQGKFIEAAWVELKTFMKPGNSEELIEEFRRVFFTGANSLYTCLLIERIKKYTPDELRSFGQLLKEEDFRDLQSVGKELLTFVQEATKK